MDHVVDFIGRDYFAQNLSVMRLDGTMILLAFLSGATVPEGASIAPILGKRLTIRGSTLRSRNAEYQGKLLHMFRDNALPKIINGEMSIEVHEVFPWTKVQEAHEEMEANRNSGKVSMSPHANLQHCISCVLS